MTPTPSSIACGEVVANQHLTSSQESAEQAKNSVQGSAEEGAKVPYQRAEHNPPFGLPDCPPSHLRQLHCRYLP
jgi:hypothetical protein